MTKQEAIELAQKIATDMRAKSKLEKTLKADKKSLEGYLRANGRTETKKGKVFKYLDGAPGLIVKLYTRSQFFPDQKKARELLNPNTFNAIFHESSSEIVDVRASADGADDDE